MSVHEQRLDIPVGEMRLEARLGYDERRGSGPGVLICHPHPQFGGSMDNNVVCALFDEFAQQGYITLAFNFRSVSRREGRYDEGQEEIQDVFGVLDWLEGLPETKGFGLGLLGYSFGAWVGLRAAVRDSRIRCVGAVAPPLAMYPFEFLNQLRSPLFVVSGGRDPFCSSEINERLVADPQEERNWKVLEGADHFFWDREKEAAQYLCEGFLKRLPTSKSR